MQFKYLNQITVALIVITGLSVMFSSVFLASEIKGLVSSYSVSKMAEVRMPLLNKRLAPYLQEDYLKIQGLVSADSAVLMEAKADKLVISANSISDESAWKKAVSEAMSMDRRLSAVKVCGSASNACAGAALAAELVGQRQIVFVSN